MEDQTVFWRVAETSEALRSTQSDWGSWANSNYDPCQHPAFHDNPRPELCKAKRAWASVALMECGRDCSCFGKCGAELVGLWALILSKLLNQIV